MPSAMHRDGDSRPIPDPTQLTTQQLVREISALKELIFTRLDAIDRATELLAEDVHRQPTEITTHVGHLKELMTTRFAERDLRNDQYSRDTKEALGEARQSSLRALTEAKEALNKRFDIAETQANGLDERVRMLMPRSESEALHKAHETRIAQIVERLNARDERGKGMSQGWVAMVAAVSLLATIAGVVMMVLSRASQ
jgi:hypothetical protein